MQGFIQDHYIYPGSKARHLIASSAEIKTTKWLTHSVPLVQIAEVNNTDSIKFHAQTVMENINQLKNIPITVLPINMN